MKTIGENIKAYRKARKLSQQQIGDVIGLQRSAVSKIERGETVNLKASQVDALCKLFHCTPSDLYGIETVTIHGTMPLTAEQEELMTLIPLLNNEQVQVLLQMVKAMGYASIQG